jgi:hypothetical protein
MIHTLTGMDKVKMFSFFSVSVMCLQNMNTTAVSYQFMLLCSGVQVTFPFGFIVM